MDSNDLEGLASLFKRACYPAQKATLQGVDKERPLMGVAEPIWISCASLQDHQDTLLREQMMVWPTDSPADFDLTPLGDYAVQLFKRDDSPYSPGMLVDDKELERAIAPEKCRRLTNKEPD